MLKKFKYFKNAEPKHVAQYHVWIEDIKHKYDDAPKEDGFTLIATCLSSIVAIDIVELELTYQYNDTWFFNRIMDDYRLIGDTKNVVAFIRRCR